MIKLCKNYDFIDLKAPLAVLKLFYFYFYFYFVKLSKQEKSEYPSFEGPSGTFPGSTRYFLFSLIYPYMQGTGFVLF